MKNNKKNYTSVMTNKKKEGNTMSTPAILAMQINDEIKWVYLHWGGNPNEAGRCLFENYNTPEKAKALIALGGLSSLEPRIAPNEGEPHSFDDPAENVTVAYHRDRGERLQINTVKIQKSLSDTMQDIFINGGYTYLFKGHSWYLVSDNTLIRLTLANTGRLTEKTKRLNLTINCKAVYNTSIFVPIDMTFDEAIAYANKYLDSIPVQPLEYAGGDVIDEENSDFDE